MDRGNDVVKGSHMFESAPLRPLTGPSGGNDLPPELSVIVLALRAFLRSETRRDVATALQATIEQLGGTVIPARGAGVADLPVDVSLGVGQLMVVRPPEDESEARFLVQQLPSLVEDALTAARRSDRYERETLRATVDDLTKVATHAEVGARIGLAGPGDVVCVLDLDDFKLLNDTHGHSAGDAALRRFGSLLRETVREDDFVGRSGGDEFVVVLRSITLDVAYGRMRMLSNKWRISGGHHGGSVSVGIATVDLRGGDVAAGAADRAMYRAKRSGRGLVERTVFEDYASAAT